jgi:hypothetical protein
VRQIVLSAAAAAALLAAGPAGALPLAFGPAGHLPSMEPALERVQYWGGWYEDDDDEGPFWGRPVPRLFGPRVYVDPRFDMDDAIAAQEAVTIARSMGYRAIAAPRRVGRTWVVVATGRAGERVQVSIDAYTGRPLAIREIAAVPPRPQPRPGERIGPDAAPMPLDPPHGLREGRIDPLPGPAPQRPARPAPSATARAAPVPVPRPDIDGPRPQAAPPLSVTPDRPILPPAASPAPDQAPAPVAPPTAALPTGPAPAPAEPAVTQPPAPPVAAPAPDSGPQPSEPAPPASAAIAPTEPAPAAVPAPVEPARAVIPAPPATEPPRDAATSPTGAQASTPPALEPAPAAPAARRDSEGEGIMVDGRFLGPDGEALPNSLPPPGVRRIDPASRN